MPRRRTSRTVRFSMTEMLPEGLTYERTEAPAFYATAYRVFLNGAFLGTVASQRDARATYWGYAVGEAEVTFAGTPSRPSAVLNLLSHTA